MTKRIRTTGYDTNDIAKEVVWADVMSDDARHDPLSDAGDQVRKSLGPLDVPISSFTEIPVPGNPNHHRASAWHHRRL